MAISSHHNQIAIQVNGALADDLAQGLVLADQVRTRFHLDPVTGQSRCDGGAGYVVVIRRVDGQNDHLFSVFQEGKRIADGAAALGRGLPGNQDPPSNALDRPLIGYDQNRRAGPHRQMVRKVQANFVLEALLMGLADDDKVGERGIFHQQIQMVALFAKTLGGRLIGLAVIGEFLLDIPGMLIGDLRFRGKVAKGRAPSGDGVRHMGRLFRIKADEMGLKPFGKLYGRLDPGLMLWVVGKMYEDRFNRHG